MKLFLLTLPVLAQCGEIVWDGRINASTTVDHFDQCTTNSQFHEYKLADFHVQGPGPTKSNRINGTSTVMARRAGIWDYRQISRTPLWMMGRA